jgi:uncharacterized membrane protein
VVPLSLILLLPLAVHGPLLLMQLPGSSYDANTHMFLASHYAHEWFNAWNAKWYGGFSQTTYPPLVHQWIALFSHVMGLDLAYMFVQLLVILLLPIGILRYARLGVDERSARFAAPGSVFLGSLAMLVYQSGQLPTTASAALTLNLRSFDLHQKSKALEPILRFRRIPSWIPSRSAIFRAAAPRWSPWM